MAGPWEKFQPSAPAAAGPWAKFAAPAAPQQPAADPSANELGIPVFNKPMSPEDLDKELGPVKKGNVLPVSYNHRGDMQFDMSAGIPGAMAGAVKSGTDLTKQAMEGGPQAILNDPTAAGRALDVASLVAPMSPGARSLPGVRGFRTAEVVPPTAAELKKAGSSGFDAIRDMNVDYHPQAVADAAGKIKIALDRDGLSERNAPQVHSVLNDLINPPEGAVGTAQGLIQARREIQQSAIPGTGNSAAAPTAIRGLEDFLRTPGEGSVLAGPGHEVSPLLDQANANYAAGKRTNTLDKLTKTSELRAAASNSGQNVDNSIRGRLVSLLQDDKKIRGFSGDEKQAIEDTIVGTKTRNALRRAGNMAGGGGGLGATVAATLGGSAGLAALGPIGMALGVVPPLAGAAMKAGENALSRKSIEKLSEAIRKRSPLYEQMVKNAPKVGGNSTKYNVLMNALMAQQGDQWN